MARSDIFGATFDALKRSLTVELIAVWEPYGCEGAESAKDKFEQHPHVSQLLYQPQGRVTGVWERDAREPRALEDSMLIAAETPIGVFIEYGQSPYRLVLRHGAIDGIVTRADLDKLPVRLLAFGMVTHMEMLMSNLIERAFPGETWLSHLTDGRQTKTKNKFLTLGEHSTTLLACTDWCDKIALLSKCTNNELQGLKRDGREIQRLRDKIAHSDTYAHGDTSLDDFLARYKTARRWVEQLHSLAGEDIKSPA